MEPRKAVEVAPRSVAITEKRSGFNLEFIDNEPAPVASAVSLYGMGRSGPTMSSLEMVEFINSQRKDGEAELRHDHFMAKVPKVLGIERAPNFRDTYEVPGPNGATRSLPCYRFPKREACLMAMSYSYDLQAKVFDRMTALEQRQITQPANPATLSRLQLIEIAMQAEQERLVLAKENTVLIEQKAAVVEQLAIAAQKAMDLDRIANAKGMFCPRDAAHILKQPEKNSTTGCAMTLVDEYPVGCNGEADATEMLSIAKASGNSIPTSAYRDGFACGAGTFGSGQAEEGYLRRKVGDCRTKV